MEEKKEIKISLSTLLVILAIIAIIVMGVLIYKLNDDNAIEIINTTTPEQVNTSKESAQNTTTDNTNKNDVTYTISTRDEAYATIKATKNGKTTSKEFEMQGTIDKTGTMEFPTIGTVALVADTAGEYYGINIYQLVDDEIKLIGSIDCGADMVKETTYTVTTKNEDIAIINAKRNNEKIKKEFQMSAAIDKASVIDVFDLGKVVLVAETSGEYYGIQVYRLSQDYTTGKTKGIIKAGSIQYDI